MSAVTRTEEWPSRSDTVAKSTPSASRKEPWVWRSVCRLAPLGSPSRRHSSDTEDDLGQAPSPRFLRFSALEHQDLPGLCERSRDDHLAPVDIGPAERQDFS